jgi:Methyltransferase FkbM domain
VNVLKLDIQGFEGPVLRGASQLLKEALSDLVFIDISFVHVYQNQTEAEEVLGLLGGSGYRLFDLYICVDPKRGN